MAHGALKGRMTAVGEESGVTGGAPTPSRGGRGRVSKEAKSKLRLDGQGGDPGKGEPGEVFQEVSPWKSEDLGFCTS